LLQVFQKTLLSRYNFPKTSLLLKRSLPTKASIVKFSSLSFYNTHRKEYFHKKYLKTFQRMIVGISPGNTVSLVVK
jgi:hypothetical protein